LILTAQISIREGVVVHTLWERPNPAIGSNPLGAQFFSGLFLDAGLFE
jgi:hypothetical protein